MRVDKERSRNAYRADSERKYDDRLKRRNNNRHYYSSRISLKSRHHYNEDYSSNRIANNPSSSYVDHTLSSRFDRPTKNRDTYSSLSTDQPILSGNLPPTDLYYNSSQSIHDRNVPSHYIDSERNRYPPSSTYRRESTPPSLSSSYRNDLYSRDEYQSSVTAPLSTQMYRTSDYNNRSERYDISQNRNCSITSQPSPVYHSDPYQTSSSYVPRDQYVQSFPSVQEVDYRTPLSIDHHHHHHHQTMSNKSSDRYDSYRKRSRSNFNENRSKRPMRR